MRSLHGRLVAHTVAGMLLLYSTGFLSWAAHLHLAQEIGPEKAALVTGLALLGLALLVVYLSRRRSRRR